MKLYLQILIFFHFLRFFVIYISITWACDVIIIIIIIIINYVYDNRYLLQDIVSFTTLAVASILLNQPLAKILVGDPHQQIYGFRGATNAMAQVTATHTYYLTQVYAAKNILLIGFIKKQKLLVFKRFL